MPYKTLPDLIDIIISASIPSELYPTTATQVCILLFLELTLTVLPLGFTSRHSLLRWAAVPAITLLAVLIGSTAVDIMPRLLLSQVPAAFACVWFTQYLISALLLGEDFEHGGPPATAGRNKPRGPDTPANRILFALNVVNSQRNIGTPQQARHVPPFSRSRPAWVPSRARFLAVNAAKALAAFLSVDILTGDPKDVSHHPIEFAEYKTHVFSRLNDVIFAELVTRAAVTLGQWVGIYCVVTMVHATLAFTTVLLRFYEPADWPPFFGSPTQLWSLRQFWGKVWHSTMQYKLTTPADWVTYTLLRLPRGTLHARYTHLTVVFLASSLCHLQMDAISPMPWRESRAPRFFLVQVAGIMAEDAVSAMYRWYLGATVRTTAPPRAWVRVLGALWVAAWLGWTTPVWVYPGLRHVLGGNRGIFLPFSLVRAF